MSQNVTANRKIPFLRAHLLFRRGTHFCPQRPHRVFAHILPERLFWNTAFVVDCASTWCCVHGMGAVFCQSDRPRRCWPYRSSSMPWMGGRHFWHRRSCPGCCHDLSFCACWLREWKTTYAITPVQRTHGLVSVLHFFRWGAVLSPQERDTQAIDGAGHGESDHTGACKTADTALPDRMGDLGLLLDRLDLRRSGSPPRILHKRSRRFADQRVNTSAFHCRGHASMAELFGMDRAMRFLIA